MIRPTVFFLVFNKYPSNFPISLQKTPPSFFSPPPPLYFLLAGAFTHFSLFHEASLRASTFVFAGVALEKSSYSLLSLSSFRSWIGRPEGGGWRKHAEQKMLEIHRRYARPNEVSRTNGPPTAQSRGSSMGRRPQWLLLEGGTRVHACASRACVRVCLWTSRWLLRYHLPTS